VDTAIDDDKCTECRADVKSTYECTDFEDDQCNCTNTGLLIRCPRKYDLYQTSAIMST